MLDALESRLLLHAVLNTTKHSLNVFGVGGVVNDVINISQSSKRIYVEHVNDGTTQSFARADVRKIGIELFEGDDKLTIQSGVGGITLPTTILGGEGSDNIIGGDGPDNIAAGNGRNKIIGNAGDDVLVGGTGIDTFTGGLGNDSINGAGGSKDAIAEFGDVNFSLTPSGLSGLGSDVLIGIKRGFLTGGPGGNTIIATKFNGFVQLDGGGGNDSLRAGPKGSLLLGGDGNDILLGNIGPDSFTGGPGNDSIRGVVDPNLLQPNDLLVESGDVNFRLTSNTVPANTSSLTGLGSDLIDHVALAHLTGGSHANTIDATGFLGQVTMLGSRGNDKLIGAFGKTTFTPGEGNDIVTGNVNGANELIESGNVDFTLRDSLLSGLGNDLLTNIKFVSLSGGAGANTLNATGFSAGSVVLDGSGGNDVLRAGPGGSILRGGDGNDSMVGNAGIDQLEPGLGNDTANGGTGVDKVMDSRDVNFTLTNTRLSVSLSDFDVLSAVETAELIGGPSANVMDASGFTLGGVTLFGLGGNDVLRGTNVTTGVGIVDQLSGGTGNDSISGNAGLDSLFEALPTGITVILTDTRLTGLGTDTLSSLEAAKLSAAISPGTDPVNIDCTGFSEDVHLEGGAGNDRLIGTALNDILFGNGGNDTLEGRAGDDLIEGRDGDDVLRGDDGNDYMVGDGGKDTFFTGIGDNTVIAQDGVGESIFAGAGTVGSASTKDLTDQITIVI